ncbi:MAG: energy transducer TonB, partial [Kiritimatiellae bacterium]|nr:energy transducer TonB [Kiritimatiellia bacterium]
SVGGQWLLAGGISLAIHALVACGWCCATNSSRVEIEQKLEIELSNLDLSFSDREDDSQAANAAAALERTPSENEPKRDVPVPEAVPPADEPPPDPRPADVAETPPAPETPDPPRDETPPPAPPATPATPAPVAPAAPAHSPVTREMQPMPPLQMEQPAPTQARVDVPPKLKKSSIKPRYPESARKRGAEGSVTLLLEVSEKGKVVKATVVESSGHADLDAAAVSEARRATFVPARADGKAVPSSARLTLAFKLR